MKITITLDDEEVKLLNKRAKKNFLDLREQVEDIVRRSCVSFSKNLGYKTATSDDRLVEVFSRQKRGKR